MVLNYAWAQLYLYLTPVKPFIIEGYYLQGHGVTDIVMECAVPTSRVEKARWANKQLLFFCHFITLEVKKFLDTVPSSDDR
jgi:hypothetical protein